MGSTLSVSAGLWFALPISNSLLNNSSISSVSTNNQSSVSDLVTSENNDQNANLSTNNGPITYIGNKITALDWYGNKKWEIDFSQYVKDSTGAKLGNNYEDGAWQCAWYNWDYNRSQDKLWVLGFYSKTSKTQPLFKINASTGEIEGTFDITYSPSINSANNAYCFVTALSSEKVMVYGGAGGSYDATASIYDPSTGKITSIKGNSSGTDVLPVGNTEYASNYKWYFFNLIPIAKNKNLVAILPFLYSINW